MISTAVAETNCTTNTLGDRTCVTTTGNILSNSTFGSNNTTTTTGWLTTGSDGIHTHGNFGTFPYGANMDQTGGVLAFEGYVEDNVFQDSALVKHGHLTQSQINEGFTSTLSADVWFWNSIENTLTLKQTITGSDGSITTQSRTINDHDPTRNFNGGTFTNYTDSYIQSPNSQTDITIRAELYNQGDGSNNDNYHRGPDVDNVELSITTLGETTNCQQLGTCTTVGTEITEAFEQIEEVLTVVTPEELFIYEEFIVEEFIPFEEPELVIEMFSEIYIEEVAVEEINVGVVNVFTLAVPEELIEMSPIAMIETFEEMPVIPMEMFEEIPMEVTYGNQETIEEISAEVEVPEERVEVEQAENNETRIEGSESTEEIASEPEQNQPVERNANVERGSESDTRTSSSETETIATEEPRESNTETDRDIGSTEEVVVESNVRENIPDVSIADIQRQVEQTTQSIDKQLVNVQLVVAKVMQNNTILEAYSNKQYNDNNERMVNINIDEYILQDYTDNRQIYSDMQGIPVDIVAQSETRISEAVSERIRAEEHLRRIRGY